MPSAPIERLRSVQSGENEFSELQSERSAPGEPAREKPSVVTVLFADIANSTVIIRKLGPERSRALVDPALDLIVKAINGHHGTVAQVMGDGVLGLFGAHGIDGSHASHALDAAIAMQRAIRAYTNRARDGSTSEIRIRVGISTGPVVIRTLRIGGVRSENLPIGKPANIAARLQSLATPGTIVVGTPTHDEAGPRYRFRPLGNHLVKGESDPVPVFELVDGRAEPFRRPLRHHLQLLRTRAGLRTALVSTGAALGLFAAIASLVLIGPSVRPSPEELAVAVGTVKMLRRVSNFANPSAEAALLQSLKVCRQGGESECEFDALMGLRDLHNFRGEFDQADEASRRMLKLASQQPEPSGFPWVYVGMGITEAMRGRQIQANERFTQCLNVAQRIPYKFLDVNETPLSVCNSWSALPLIRLGRIDEARRRMSEGLEIARKSQDPYTLATNLSLCLSANGLLFDVPERMAPPELHGDWVEEGIAISDHFGFAQIASQLKIMKAWGGYWEGDSARAVRELRAAGDQGASMIVEGFSRGSNYVYPALRYLEDLDANSKCDSSCLQTRGELLLRAQPPDHLGAEQCFRRAITVAASNGDKYFQLTAATSLARLLIRQSKVEEARTLLHPIYSSFRQGFDVPALVSARRVLDLTDKLRASSPPGQN